jgi:hypothetical protein
VKRAAVATQVRPTKVVRENDDDVGLLLRWVGRGLLEQAKKRGDEQQKCKTLFFHDFNSLLILAWMFHQGEAALQRGRRGVRG